MKTKKIASGRSLSSGLLQNNERYHRPSCESQCLGTPLTTANCFLCRAEFTSQVTGTRWTTSVIPSHVTVPGQHRRFDGALATLARCILREEHHENLAEHIGRVTSVDHGQELLTLPAIPLLPPRGREIRRLWCCISRGCVHRLTTRHTASRSC